MTHASSRSDCVPDDPPRSDRTLHRVFAGAGSGQPCAHCHELISESEVEYELADTLEAWGAVQQPAPRFHRECYELWRNTVES